MLRFTENRWWAFILALCLFAACFLFATMQVPTVARAEILTTQYVPGDDGLSSGGDPDVPVGPGNGSPSTTVKKPGASSLAVNEARDVPAGDGMPWSSGLMERLRLYLLSLRISFLRF